jgi:hypothetical protein
MTIARHARRALAALALLVLPLAPAARAQQAPPPWDAKWYNPKPETNPKPGREDLILPLPCGGAMAFRPVDVPAGTGVLADRPVTLGEPEVDLGYFDYVRNAFLAAPFPAPGGGRALTFTLVPAHHRLLWVDMVDLAWVTLLAAYGAQRRAKRAARYQAAALAAAAAEPASSSSSLPPSSSSSPPPSPAATAAIAASAVRAACPLPSGGAAGGPAADEILRGLAVETGDWEEEGGGGEDDDDDDGATSARAAAAAAAGVLEE